MVLELVGIVLELEALQATIESTKTKIKLIKFNFIFTFFVILNEIYKNYFILFLRLFILIFIIFFNNWYILSKYITKNI